MKAYSKLLGIGPRKLGELLDGDPTAVIEPTLVDNVGGFLATFRYYVVGAEVVGGGFEVGEGEFREGRGGAGFRVGSGGERRVVGRGPRAAVGLLVVGGEFLGVSTLGCKKLGITATHGGWDFGVQGELGGVGR